MVQFFSLQFRAQAVVVFAAFGHCFCFLFLSYNTPVEQQPHLLALGACVRAVQAHVFGEPERVAEPRVAKGAPHQHLLLLLLLEYLLKLLVGRIWGRSPRGRGKAQKGCHRCRHSCYC